MKFHSCIGNMFDLKSQTCFITIDLDDPEVQLESYVILIIIKDHETLVIPHGRSCRQKLA